jgi:hypothetical protein
VSAVNVAPNPEGGWIVGVVAKRTYDVAAGSCRVAAEQSALVERPIPGAAPFLLEHDSDLIVNRRLTDLVIKGHAYPPSRAHSAGFDATVSIDGWTKVVRVFGDRRCEWRTGAQLRFGPAAPIEKVPLDWPFAYGGVDASALKRYGDPAEAVARKLGLPYLPFFGMFAYPRNPLGRGYVTEAAAAELDGLLLPNLEDPRALVNAHTLVLGDFRAWPRAPMPAGFNWLPYAFFPRSSQAGFPMRPYWADEIAPEQFSEVAHGTMTTEQIRAAPLPNNGHLGVVQGAAVGMRLEAIEPGASVRIVNLHPQRAEWRFTLRSPPPDVRLRFAGESVIQVEPRIRLLEIEPDCSRVSVVWVAQLRRDVRPTERQIAVTQHAVTWPG